MKIILSLIISALIFIGCAEKKKIENKPLATAWERGHFVDEFGDSTNQQYIVSFSRGTFSNSATANSKLYVKVIVQGPNERSIYRKGRFRKDVYSAVGIFLNEYGRDVSATFVSTGIIKAKNSAGEILEIYSTGKWSDDGGLLVDDEYAIKLVEFFNKNSDDTVKFSIKDTYSSSYNFELDLTGFKEAYNKLEVQKKIK